MRSHIDDSASAPAFLRSDLEKLGLNPRTRDTLETLQSGRDVIIQSINDLVDDTNEIEQEPFVTWNPVTALLTGSRLLSSTSNIAIAHDATTVTADLTDTGVSAGTYGAATKLVVLAIDAKGRVTSASEITLNSDNVAEGSTNLYFTQARARGSLSAGSGISYNSGTGQIALAAVPGVAGTHASPTSITINGFGQVTAISP